ncbi:MAG TPA: thioesterase family protein [Acidimicrobiales bacterium]
MGDRGPSHTPAASFVHRIRVRYGEVDMQHVVFNAHYLAYCDDACESFVRACGVRAMESGWDFMVKKAVVEWSGGATVGDELAIAVGVSRWGTTSFDMRFAGAVDDRPVFEAVVTYVGVRHGTLEPIPPPPAVKDALAGGPPV